MEQKKNNQERARKYGGSSSYVDMGEPSKAPRQDEDGRDLIRASWISTRRRNITASASKASATVQPRSNMHFQSLMNLAVNRKRPIA